MLTFKTKLTHFVAKISLVFILLIGLSGTMFGQTTVTHTFLGTGSVIDANIRFSTEKNSSNNFTEFDNNGFIKLFAGNNTNVNGNSITLHPSNGAIITKAILTIKSGTDTPPLTYSVNGVGSTTVNNSSNTYTILLTSSTSDVLSIKNAHSGSDVLSLISVSVTYTLPAPCTPSTNIASFLPTSGPCKSLVTITGSGFTGATNFKFGNIDAVSFTVVNNTTIIAEVPSGIDKEVKLSVYGSNSCPTKSINNFSIISPTGSCPTYPNYSDLFISELYAYSNNHGYVWNIELYNPTSNPITLTNVYQLNVSKNGTPTTYKRIINLVGVVPANSVFMISAGNDTQRCSTITYNYIEPGPGLDQNDFIKLFKNGILSDVSHTNDEDFSVRRKSATTITAPKATYTGSDWDIIGNETCADLGSFTLPSTPVTITIQPINSQPCASSINMTVASSTSGVTYQWKYNNPASMTGWQDVNATNLPNVTISGATGVNLQITGTNVSNLSNYQFYCEVKSGSCSKASDAAQFKADSRPIYRSVANSNGNWSTVANWEMSNDYINYVTACTYPRANNSSEVIIQGGTRIVLDLTGANAIDIDKITIDVNGTLELQPTAKLTVLNSNVGADLVVNGTLFDRTASGSGIVFIGTNSWKLGINGTIIKSNNSSISKYKNKYESGMSLIPASANWIFRYNGDGDPVVGTEGFYYPNLSFENTTAASYSWNNNTNSFNGSASYATIKGDINIGTTSTGTGSCFVGNSNTNAQPLLILGNLNIATGCTLSNLTSQGFGKGFEVKGNLLVDGIFDTSDGTLDPVLKLSGIANQTISGSGTINLYRLNVSKPSGDVLLNKNLQMIDLVMMQGNIITNTNLLQLGKSTSIKGTLSHTSGYVVGKMRRWFDGVNIPDNSSALFPIGHNDSGLKNRFARINFTSAPAAGGHLTVEYLPTAMGLAGIPIPATNTGGAGFDVLTTEDQGYWKIDNEENKLIGGAYTIACTGEGYQNISVLSNLTLLKRVGTGNWFCPGSHLAVTGTLAAPIVSRSGVSNWSNFGFGGGIGNPLPVTLTAFNIACEENILNNKSIKIRWTTASELNSSHFVVEKSRDLSSWFFVSQIEAAGNSNREITYSSTDVNASNGTFYYRLKQVDLNGELAIYGPISISCQNENNSMNVYPNPSHGNFTVEISWCNETTQTKLQIVDLTGKVINEVDVNLNEGTTQVEFSHANLPSGTYLIYLDGEQARNLKPIRLVISN